MKYRAFTLVDLVGSLVIVTLVAGLVFPTIQAARETARRTACLDKMRNVGLAMREYHNVHKTLPGHRIGPGADNRISAFTFLLPQLGHQALYDEIVAQKWQDPWRLEKVDSNGRSIRNTTSPYCTTISEILCPEDTAFLSKNERETAYTNYVVSHGDWITGQNEPFTRGPFVPGKKRRFEDIPDGLSHTIALSERAIAADKFKHVDSDKEIVRESDGTIKTQGIIIVSKNDANPDDPEKPRIDASFQKAKNGIFIATENLEMDRGRSGTRWGDGQHFFTVTNTILPPNSASCMVDGNDVKPIIAPPTSYHIGGVNILMLDGQAKFVTNKIDCGGDFLNKKCVKEGTSPFGIWGALGSIADSNVISTAVE